VETPPYLDLLRALSDAGVRHAVVGGVAVALHGVPRATFDLDLLVDLDDGENASRLVAVLSSLGYRPRVPVPLAALADASQRREWIEQRHMRAFSVGCDARPMEEVDVLIDPGVPWADASFEIRSVGGVPVPVVTRDVLVAMKRLSGRPVDLADVAALEKLP
jgi:hypothetical protein